MASRVLKMANMLNNLQKNVEESGDESMSLEEAIANNPDFIESIAQKLAGSDSFLQQFSGKITEKVDSGEVVSDILTTEKYIGDESIVEFLN